MSLGHVDVRYPAVFATHQRGRTLKGRYRGRHQPQILDDQDDRPTEDAGVELIEHEAATAERRGPESRGMVVPGRIGSSPSLALQYGVISVVLVGATLVAGLIAGRQAPPGPTVALGTAPASTPPVTDPHATPAATPGSAPGATFPAFAVDPSYTCNLEAGTYGGRFGSVRVTATTPTTWHGLQDVFHAEDEGCGGGGGVRLEITVASEVYRDSCVWRGSGVEIGGRAARAAAFSEQTLFDVVGPIKTELGGYPARRYDFTVPVDLDTTSCSDSVLQLWRDPARLEGLGPTTFSSGSMTVYFVAVEAVTLGVYVFKGDEGITPDMFEELDAVVASLVFEPWVDWPPARSAGGH